MNKEDVKKGYLAAMATLEVDYDDAQEYWQSYEASQYWGKRKLASYRVSSDVSDQRELLISFGKHMNPDWDYGLIANDVEVFIAENQ